MTQPQALRQKLQELRQTADSSHPPAPEEVQALRRELGAGLAELAQGLGPAPTEAQVQAFEQALALGLELEALILQLARQGEPAYLDLPGLRP